MNLRFASMIAIPLFFCAATRAQSPPGNAAAGKYASAMCEGCHDAQEGYKTDFPEVYRVPMLNGQSAAYLVQSLKDYRSGARRNPTMKAVANVLTTQQIADLSAYYAIANKQNGKQGGG